MLDLERVNTRRVWAACYRVTGSAADADEIVQEALTRALETEPVVSEAEPLEPWIMSVAVRIAIDRLRRRRAATYDGPWLPSPVELEEGPTLPNARYELLESATFAFLLALEALSPLQRAVLVLRDVLDLSVAEAASALGESEVNVRALHHRARVRLARYDQARVRPTAAVQARAREVLELFFQHLLSGDTAAALALLSEDVLLVNDAGGAYHAARNVIRGAASVTRFFGGLLKKVGLPDEVRVRLVNGLPAAEMFYRRGVGRYAPHVVTGVAVDPYGHVALLYTVLAPQKLASLARSRSAVPSPVCPSVVS